MSIRSVLAGLVVLAASTVASAQKPDAQAAFERGRALMARGEVAHACAEFEASMRFEAEWGTLYNLAICHETLGKLATAKTEFDELAANDTNARRGRDARQRAAALQPRLTRMKLVVDAPAPGLVVKRDDVDVTSLVGTDAPVDPGRYTFVAQAPGREPVTVVAELTGEGVTVPVTIPAFATSAAAPAADGAYPMELPLRPLALSDRMLEVSALGTVGTASAYMQDAIDSVGAARIRLGRFEVGAALDLHLRSPNQAKPNEPESIALAARYVLSPMFTAGIDYTSIEPRGGAGQGSDLRGLVERKRVMTPSLALDGRAGFLFARRDSSSGERDGFGLTGEGKVQLAAATRLSFEAETRLDVNLGGNLYTDTFGLSLGGLALVAVAPRIDVVAAAYFVVVPSSWGYEAFSLGALWRSR